MFRESISAATEGKRSTKYDLRYVSGGVFTLCERLGHVRVWTGWPKEKRPAVDHEHVLEKRQVYAAILRAASEKTVGEILSSAEGCVVTRGEHNALHAASGEGWQRYANAGLTVWDRAIHNWKTLHPPTQR